jgi:hypothetical protein
MLVEGLGDGVTGVLVVSVSVAEVVASGSSVSVTGSVVVDVGSAFVVSGSTVASTD